MVARMRRVIWHEENVYLDDRYYKIKEKWHRNDKVTVDFKTRDGLLFLDVKSRDFVLLCRENDIFSEDVEFLTFYEQYISKGLNTLW